MSKKLLFALSLLAVCIAIAGIYKFDYIFALFDHDAERKKPKVIYASEKFLHKQRSKKSWIARLPNRAAGKKSVPLSKLMKLAKAAADKGDTAEAERLLKRINFAAKMGMEQHRHPGKIYYPSR